MIKVIPSKCNSQVTDLTKDYVNNFLSSDISDIFSFFRFCSGDSVEHNIGNNVFEVCSGLPTSENIERKTGGLYQILLDFDNIRNGKAVFCADIEFSPNTRTKTYKPLYTPSPDNGNENDYEVNDILLGEYRFKWLHYDGEYNECQRKIILYYNEMYKAAKQNSIPYEKMLSIVLAHEMLHCLHEIFLYVNRYHKNTNGRYHTWNSTAKLSPLMPVTAEWMNMLAPDILGYPYVSDLYADVPPIIKESLATYFELSWAEHIGCQLYTAAKKQNLSGSPYFYPYKHFKEIRNNSHFIKILTGDEYGKYYWYLALYNMFNP